MNNTDFKTRFAELLSKTYISSDASSDEVCAKWNDLNLLLFENIPKVV